MSSAYCRGWRFAVILLILGSGSAGFVLAQTASPVTATASNVTADAATLFGSVNPNGLATTAWFEYGTGFVLGTRAGEQFLGSGSVPVNTFADLRGLQPDTTYYFRLAAQNNYGVQYGQTLTFRTAPRFQGGPPSVQTGAVRNVAASSAVVEGTVTPNGADTTAWFEYGTVSSLGRVSESRLVPGDNAGTKFTFALGGLRAGTKYFYRIAARNQFGTARGETGVFTTTGAPGPAPAPPAPAPAPSPAPVPPPVPPAAPPLTLTATTETPEPQVGREFTYTAHYRNEGEEIEGAKLTVSLPHALQYVVANPLPNLENNNLIFDLKTIPAGAEADVTVRLKVKEDAREGESLPIAAVLTYTNQAGDNKTASANLAVVPRPAPPPAVRSGGWAWYTWIAVLLLGLIIASIVYILYRYWQSRNAMRST